MKRTQCFTYRVYKGGTATINLVPFQGWGFFVFQKLHSTLYENKEEFQMQERLKELQQEAIQKIEHSSS
jgi:hypothetical protein